MSMTIEQIEQRTKAFAEARQVLAERIEALRDEQESAQRRRMTGIRSALVRFRTAHEDLHQAIDQSRDAFRKPKTRILHGVRVGWAKRKGKLEFDDAERLVRAIERLFGEQAAALIKTTKRPVASALENLPAADLKRLGVRITDDGEAVVIKPVDGDVQKLIDGLINDPEIEEVQ